ncbi:energy transducer TonB [Synechococcus sp. Nb3U1]|uniref:energy transducer TonB n=1 Tax=Synechococcus sp. Nb3U1 TaxID=1914529 RepID=UPI001F34C77F|nr:energy transducer TonB [Synechococcus sp. Nb3U1]MCF2970363.1 energy transducer TonB [Synechococcus sp. Nb3U1]
MLAERSTLPSKGSHSPRKGSQGSLLLHLQGWYWQQEGIAYGVGLVWLELGLWAQERGQGSSRGSNGILGIRWIQYSEGILSYALRASCCCTALCVARIYLEEDLADPPAPRVQTRDPQPLRWESWVSLLLHVLVLLGVAWWGSRPLPERETPIPITLLLEEPAEEPALSEADLEAASEAPSPEQIPKASVPLTPTEPLPEDLPAPPPEPDLPPSEPIPPPDPPDPVLTEPIPQEQEISPIPETESLLSLQTPTPTPEPIPTPPPPPTPTPQPPTPLITPTPAPTAPPPPPPPIETPSPTSTPIPAATPEPIPAPVVTPTPAPIAQEPPLDPAAAANPVPPAPRFTPLLQGIQAAAPASTPRGSESGSPEPSGEPSSSSSALTAPGAAASPNPAPPAVAANPQPDTLAQPIPGRNPPPQYPPQARRLNQQGQVLLQAKVNSQGQVQNVEILTSSGFPALDNAAQQAVQGWQFTPALRNNIPIDSWVTVPIQFALN